MPYFILHYCNLSTKFLNFFLRTTVAFGVSVDSSFPFLLNLHRIYLYSFTTNLVKNFQLITLHGLGSSTVLFENMQPHVRSYIKLHTPFSTTFFLSRFVLNSNSQICTSLMCILHCNGFLSTF